MCANQKGDIPMQDNAKSELLKVAILSKETIRKAV